MARSSWDSYIEALAAERPFKTFHLSAAPQEALARCFSCLLSCCFLPENSSFSIANCSSAGLPRYLFPTLAVKLLASPQYCQTREALACFPGCLSCSAVTTGRHDTPHRAAAARSSRPERDKKLLSDREVARRGRPSAFLTLSVYRGEVSTPDVSPRSEARGPQPVGTFASPLGSSKREYRVVVGQGGARGRAIEED